jgi:hypothetical protein
MATTSRPMRHSRRTSSTKRPATNAAHAAAAIAA